MRAMIARFANVIFHPDTAWPPVVRAAETPLAILSRVVAPLAAVPPLAFAFQAIRGERVSPGAALLGAIAGWSSEIAFVALVAAVVWLVAPLYRVRRDFGVALRVVAYAALPVWIAGIALAAPLQAFPLLTVILLIGLMHALYLFYAGLHHIAGVARSEAAECAGVVVFASFVLSSVLGYYGSAAGLFPKIG